MGKEIQNAATGKLIDEVTVGSVTIPIYQAPVTVRRHTPANGEVQGQAEFKTYDSYLVSYYEGSLRVQRRRRTLALARQLAKEVATRLNKDGARAEFLSERDRRILVLAKGAAQSTELEVDEICRKYVELQRRLKTGTLEQAVDLLNDHGQGVRHGVLTAEVYQEYLVHLEKRNIGNYYLRDVKRYVGGFVAAFRLTAERPSDKAARI